MAKLTQRSVFEAENPIEINLREAFTSLAPQLKPPFSLKIPTKEEYLNLNRAILYAILTEPNNAHLHVKHLHGIITDGYCYFTRSLVEVVNTLYARMDESVQRQLIWASRVMVDVLAVGFDDLLVSLLRQIIGGDLGDENLWLCYEMAGLFYSNYEYLLDEEPLVLTSALYVFLRLLSDHFRASNGPKVEALRQLEIAFCVKMLRGSFDLCLKIGRDLIRLLQDLVHVPEFRAIWKDLLCNPSSFKTADFSDISQIYRLRTSSRYFLLRLTPEMESQLRFLLGHVKLGSQRRYQLWFSNKFLAKPGRNTVVIDIVRFVCCAHHPCNEIINSDIIPRWAVVGWLLKSGLQNHVEANAKLALFYDWLFFDEGVDSIMNVEPAMLLMMNSVPRYADVTNSLLDFLFILCDNYDLERKEVLINGISGAFRALVSKGVVQSIDVLISCDMIPPFLKEKLTPFFNSLPLKGV